MECVGSYYYCDGELRPVSGDEEFPVADLYFYEVIRSRNGVPLFFADHISRLQDGISTRYAVSPALAAEVQSGFRRLVRHDPHPEINVRVTVLYTEQSHTIHICYTQSSYPSAGMTAAGVPLILYHAERLEPGVKMLNRRLRLSVDEQLKRSGAYEALLVNSEGMITEGSRSNIFFISGDGTVVTAPDSMVLPGITRKYVMEIIAGEKISLRLDTVGEKETGNYRSAFITGTSPMVLPVRTIEESRYDVSDPLITLIQQRYREMVEKNISHYLKENQDD